MPSRTEFHDGELAIQAQLKVPPSRNPTSPGLPMRYAMRITDSPLMAIGTLDTQGRPWATIWGGASGFTELVADSVLGVRSRVDTQHDPVYEALSTAGVLGGGRREGAVVAGLAIDLATRDRVKIEGRVVAGAVSEDSVQMAVLVEGCLGNCPKYLNKKDITPRQQGKPELVSSGRTLSPEAVELVEQADLFFIASTSGETMDTNHRGGGRGFLRVLRNDEDGAELIYPEYSGNRLYQTLGNLKLNPKVGIVIPNFTTSDALYLTGTATILIGEAASSLLQHTSLAVKISITDSRMVTSSLPFRGAPVDFSPYNPPIRRLLTDKAIHNPEQPTPNLTALLTRREVLTPTIGRYTFKLSGQATWEAGQWVAMGFEDELSGGYAHMKDDDPQSLNDDLVRTFTISSPPPIRSPDGFAEFQITAKRHGPVTSLLARHSLSAPLEIPVLGFGGDESFRMAAATQPGSEVVFIAGGVGITPLLAQAKELLDGGAALRLLWTLRAEDHEFAQHVFADIEGLKECTSLFVTGTVADDVLQKLGAGYAESRRIERDDVQGLRGKGAIFFLCAAPALLSALNEWLQGEDVRWEDFGY